MACGGQRDGQPHVRHAHARHAAGRAVLLVHVPRPALLRQRVPVARRPTSSRSAAITSCAARRPVKSSSACWRRICLVDTGAEIRQPEFAPAASPRPEPTAPSVIEMNRQTKTTCPSHSPASMPAPEKTTFSSLSDACRHADYSRCERPCPSHQSMLSGPFGKVKFLRLGGWPLSVPA